MVLWRFVATRDPYLCSMLAREQWILVELSMCAFFGLTQHPMGLVRQLNSSKKKGVSLWGVVALQLLICLIECDFSPVLLSPLVWVLCQRYLVVLILNTAFNGWRISPSTSDVSILERGQYWLTPLSICYMCQSQSAIVHKSVPALLYNTETRGKRSGYLALMISNIFVCKILLNMLTRSSERNHQEGARPWVCLYVMHFLTES